MKAKALKDVQFNKVLLLEAGKAYEGSLKDAETFNIHAAGDGAELDVKIGIDVELIGDED